MKPFASCATVERHARYYMNTCFTVWMFTLAIPPVHFFLLSISRPDQKVLKVRGTVVCYKRWPQECSFYTWGYIYDVLMVTKNAHQVGKVWMESDH